MSMGRRELILATLLALVPIAAWFFVFQPRNADIRTVRAETDAMQSTLRRLQELGRDVGDIERAIDEAEDNLDQFRKNIPDADDVDELLGAVDTIAMRHALEVASVRTLVQVDTAEFSELPISLRLEGEFVGVYGFLCDLERLPRVTRVRALELKRDRVRAARGETDSDVVQLDLTLVIYFNHASNRHGGLLSRGGG